MRNGTVRQGLVVVALVLVPGGWAAGLEIPIDRDNIEVTESVTIAPGDYRVADADGNGVLHVRADNVIVDFHGVSLHGLPPEGADLSRAEGVGIAIENARNVTVRGARVHGYHFNIRALNAPGLKLEECDVSRSKAQRIAAGGQPIPLWLHLRSLDAWRDYGAGLWLERCDGATVRGCRGHGAQNGLLLVHSAECTVTDNDFSYNSGFGIGLWAACRNTVAWNRADFVNRPWGGGWGGDSAGLVVVNDAHENYIVANSLTHGGDGFFLTDRVNGGINHQQKTTRIEGSCDRNIVAYNDGSWSTANAFEGTFSKGNVYYRNLANDSHYGFWLGFSDNSLLFENDIRGNHSDGIAIEQGSGTRIEGNTFADNRGAAISLWSQKGWLQERHPSTNLEIRSNEIRHCGRDCRLDNSTDVFIADNRVTDTPQTPFASSERAPSGAFAAFKKSEAARRVEQILAGKPAGFVMYRDGRGPKGVEWLVPDSFAPRDDRGNLVACRSRDAGTLELLPLVDGKLEISLPDWMTRTREGDAWVVSARPSEGPGELRDYRVTVTAPGAAGRQTLTGTLLTVEWQVRWYRWDQPSTLRYDDAEAWKKLFASEPIFTQVTRRLGTDLWAEAFEKGVPRSHFALVARTMVTLPGGRYRVASMSDDGIRVFLDGQEIISRWNHHGPTPDATELDVRGGVHAFEVHYCQEGGASALALTWQKMN